MPLLEIKIDDPQGNYLGTVRAIDNAGERYYYTSDFEDVLNFSSMNCSKIPYLLTDKKVKIGKYVVATWEDILSALKKIQKPNSLVRMILQRTQDPSIQPVINRIEIQHSKIYRFFDSLPANHETMIRLMTFHNVINNFESYQEQWPDFKFSFQDLFKFSALEMSELVQKVSAAIEKEKKDFEQIFPEPQPIKEEQQSSINVPLPNGGSISLTINLNIGGKNE